MFSGAALLRGGLPSGVAIASVATVGYLGFIVGPPLIGALGELLSLPAARGLVVALTTLVAIIARRLPATAGGGAPCDGPGL